MEELVLELVLLPFRLFWWAFKHDFGLLENPPGASEKARGLLPPASSSTVYDRELDGPDIGRVPE